MSKQITKEAFDAAEYKMEQLLAKATAKGGFEALTDKEKKSLAEYTSIVKSYEDEHYTIPMPETLQGLLALKMYEKNLKQKELAQLLNTSDTQLSEIIHNKRKPSVSFLKSLHTTLGIDGNLLLKMV